MKHRTLQGQKRVRDRSIHPQGWVPVETVLVVQRPQEIRQVAFTPKGGCPLKLTTTVATRFIIEGSIHPQGWVPVETDELCAESYRLAVVAFTPKGGCPLKLCIAH